MSSTMTTTTLQKNGPYSLNTESQTPRQFPPTVNLYSGGTFSRTFYLGPHQDQPLYAVSTHSGWSGNADIVLHSTASGDKNSPIMATYEAHPTRRRASVILPGGDERTVKFTGFTARGRHFSIETAGGKPEQFEWHTGGGAHGLGGMQGKHLVRCRTGETVAASAKAVMSGHKQYMFQFVGSGASGELGERFAVMAVITALGMWDQARKRGRAGAAAGAGA